MAGDPIETQDIVAATGSSKGFLTKDALIVGLEPDKFGPVLDFEPKQINAGARVFFGVVSALVARPGLAVTPFFGEPCEPGFERSTARVVVHECGVDAEGVVDPEGWRPTIS